MPAPPPQTRLRRHSCLAATRFVGACALGFPLTSNGRIGPLHPHRQEPAESKTSTNPAVRARRAEPSSGALLLALPTRARHQSRIRPPNQRHARLPRASFLALPLRRNTDPTRARSAPSPELLRRLGRKYLAEQPSEHPSQDSKERHKTQTTTRDRTMLAETQQQLRHQSRRPTR